MRSVAPAPLAIGGGGVWGGRTGHPPSMGGKRRSADVISTPHFRLPCVPRRPRSVPSPARTMVDISGALALCRAPCQALPGVIFFGLTT